MAQKTHWSQTFVNGDGTPATDYYIQALDNSAPSNTKTIWEDADGSTSITDSVAEADTNGVISFFADGVYDLKLYEMSGSTPDPSTDALLETFTKVRIADPAAFSDSYTIDTLATAALQGAHGAQISTVAANTLTLVAGKAVYYVTSASDLETISDSGFDDGSVIILIGAGTFDITRADNIFLHGIMEMRTGRTLVLAHYGSYWFEVGRSYNAEVYAGGGSTQDLANPITLNAGEIASTKVSGAYALGGSGTVTSFSVGAPRGQIFTLVGAAGCDLDLVAGTANLEIDGDFTLSAEGSITLVKLADELGVEQYYEIARQGQWGGAGQAFPGTSMAISGSRDSYILRGSGGSETPVASIENITGGRNGQRVTFQIDYPAGQNDDGDSADITWLDRRVHFTHNTTDSGAGRVYMDGSCDFGFIPKETVTFVRTDVGNGDYYWTEVNRIERSDVAPAIKVLDKEIDWPTSGDPIWENDGATSNNANEHSTSKTCGALHVWRYQHSLYHPTANRVECGYIKPMKFGRHLVIMDHFNQVENASPAFVFIEPGSAGSWTGNIICRQGANEQEIHNSGGWGTNWLMFTSIRIPSAYYNYGTDADSTLADLAWAITWDQSALNPYG